MKSRSLIIIFMLSLYLTEIVIGQDCSTANTCGECYAIPACVWCSSPGFIGVRCFAASSSVTCSMKENTPNNVTIDELELNSDNQISLKKSTVRLRVGQTQSFNVSIRAAENFPLDLYMLVDLSGSLRDDLETIKLIASDIAETIRNISTRFQVGFGTFVDKVTLPYISRVQITGMSLTGNATLPFSYVHNVNLTNNSAVFDRGFQDLIISTNVDDPEGTFDAMLQAVLCPEVVGWRTNARKILMVLTDDVLHSAGDGRMAGIVKPASEECQMMFDPEIGLMSFVNNLQYDYPSVEQIREVFQKNIVVPVFAATSEFQSLFEQVAAAMEGSGAVTAIISQNSSNIIDVIQTAYLNIISNVALSFVPPKNFTITYRVECPEGSTLNSNGLSCSNVTVNQTTTFTIDVKLERCSKTFQNENIVVTVPAYGNFEIELVGICQCDCEEDAIPNSEDCSFNGSLSCGVCECNPGWTGDICNCFELDGSTDCPTFANQECSNRGVCQCGVCSCGRADSVEELSSPTRYRVTDRQLPRPVILYERPKINESACECDNFRCSFNDDTSEVCSGPNNGQCTCTNGILSCVCKLNTYNNKPYTGEACECTEANCYDQRLDFDPSVQPCNGNGQCNPCNNNNPCTCRPGFSTRFCIAINTSFSQCESVERTCVQCIADNVNHGDVCQCRNTSTREYVRLSEPQRNDSYEIPNSQGDTESCSFQIADPICTYKYYIATSSESIGNNQKQLVYIEPSDCFPLRWWHLALILLAVFIIFGILILIIVKLIFMCLDYAELKKFQKEVAEADLSKNFNPLYQSPEVKYDNIAFGKE